jgi:uncharacterized repeat protein (TIGR03803 family)
MNIRGSAILIVLGLRLLAGAVSSAAQETVLHNFGAGGTDGTQPFAGLTFHGKGNLYGTTHGGGANVNLGTVFELSPAAGGSWTEKVLYSFGATSSDGSYPYSSVAFDATGHLYGTTYFGGSHPFDGTVFELTPAADGSWAETVLHSFGATGKDGIGPRAGLIFDAKGILYGTTAGGGAYSKGTVFKLSSAADGSWTEKVLYSFGESSEDGSTPISELIFDGKGNLYGTTWLGGAQDQGTVFELSPAEGGTWAEKILHSFGASSGDGTIPQGGVIFDSQGNLYGTTSQGGGTASNGGTVFKLSREADGSWTEKVLHSFGADSQDGLFPEAGLVFVKGNLYGTTEQGGTHRTGTVFQLSPAAESSWKERILHNFGGASADGHNPYAGLIADAEGNLYGTTFAGGSGGSAWGIVGGAGTVFEIASDTTVAIPEISPRSGAFLDAQTVKITDSTPGATIYYTTDGDTPTASSEKYADPIEVSESETVKAIAEAKGLTDSGVATARYEIDESAAEPAFSEPGASYKSAQLITITDKTPDSTIYYTTNGKTPTASSTRYTRPVKVSESETIEAIAVARGYKTSKVASAAYVIHLPAAAAPAFPPATGTAPLGP